MQRVFEHNTGYCVTVYLTKRKEGKWSLVGRFIHLPVKERGQRSKGLEGNEGNVFYAFQSKRKRGIHAFLSTCRLADAMLRPAVDFRDGKANVHFTETSRL